MLNDIASFSIDGGPQVAVNTAEVALQLTPPVATEVTVSTSGPVGPVLTAIETGPQGPQGVQNVYVQANDPAVEHGWGPAQTNYIWIKI